MVLKTGSISPSNQMRTRVGLVSTVWPTRGSERSGSACAHASDGTSMTASTARAMLSRKCRSEHSMKRCPGEDLWRDVVEVEVHLSEDTHVLARTRVHRDPCLEPELNVPTEPDDARVHRARRLAGRRAVERCLHYELHQRHQAVEGRAESHVPDEAL